MQEFFSTAIAMNLLLVILFEFIFGPVLVLWWFLSVRRSLRRIADALEVAQRSRPDTQPVEQDVPLSLTEKYPPHIANSAFGR
jgi:hypothetical protein